MEEKYIQELYNQLGGKNRFGEYKDFQTLISTNTDYQKAFHKEIGENVLGNFNDFSTLVKKKEPTQLPSKTLSSGVATPSPTPTKSQLSETPIIPDDVSTAKLKVVEYGGFDKPPARTALDNVKYDWFNKRVGQMDDKTLLNSYVAYGTDKDFFGNLQGYDPITKEINRRLQTGLIQSPYKNANEYLQAVVNSKANQVVTDKGKINDVAKVNADYNAENKKAYRRDIAQVWQDVDNKLAEETKAATEKLKQQKVATPKIYPQTSDINAMLPSSQYREFMASKGTGDVKLQKAIDDYAKKAGVDKNDILIKGTPNKKELYLKKDNEVVPMVYDEESNKIGEKGVFWSMAAQSIGESIRNTANGLDIANAIENENNPNKALYLAKQFKKEEDAMPKKLSGKFEENILGNAGELGGGFLPYAHPLSMGTTSVYGNVNANAQRILNDDKLTDEQKAQAISKTTKTAQDIGLLETMGFELPKVAGALKGTAEASNLLDKYKPTSVLRQDLKSAAGQINTILKETPKNIAHLSSVGGGKEILNVLNLKDAGVNADFSKVPDEALGMAKLAVGMNLGRVLMVGLKKLATARQAQIDKVDPNWYNKYDAAVTGQLIDIVRQPDYIYNRIIKDLSDMPDMPEVQQAKQKIKDFRNAYESLPKDLSEAQKTKALNLIQLREDALMNKDIDKANTYDNVLNKIINEPIEEQQPSEVGGVSETPIQEEAKIPTTEGDESIGTPTTTNATEESSVAETKPIKNIQPPTEEQILNDLKNKNFATFTYGSEAEVPEQLKDKISSKGEINGEKFVKVTLPQSEADYLLAKGEVPKTKPIKVVQPTEEKQVDDYNRIKDEITNFANNTGLKVRRLSESKTDYGESHYLEISNENGDVKKIRISDHSVENPSRMSDEVHFRTSDKEMDIKKELEKVEQFLKPENFEKKETINRVTRTIEVPEKGENGLKDTDKIISERISKNGNKVYKVERTYSEPKVEFVRKPTEQPKETIPNVEDIDTKIKEAQSNHDAAKRELDKAIEKVGKTQGEQTSMFDATQKGMFAVDENEAKKILEPLKQKVKETKAELDNLLNRKKIEDEKQQELFDEEKPITKRQTNAEIRSKLKEIYEANTPESLALEYFANGGKVNASELTNEVVGSVGDSRLTKGSNKKRIAAERGGVKEDALVSNTDKNTIKQVAEALYAKANKHLDSDLGFDDNDVRNALIEVLGNHNSWQSVADEYINKYHPEEVRKNYEKQLEEHYAAYEKEHKQEFENLSIDDINAMLLEEAEQTDNFEEHLNYIKNEQKSSNATNEEPNKRTKSEVNNENESRKGNEKEQANIGNQSIKQETNALQEPSTSSVLQPTQEAVGETRSERERMEQGKQGEAPAKESGNKTNIKEQKEIGSIFDEALDEVYKVNENGEFKKANIMAENKFKSKYGEKGGKVIDVVKNFKKYAKQLGIEIKC